MIFPVKTIVLYNLGIHLDLAVHVYIILFADGEMFSNRNRMVLTMLACFGAEACAASRHGWFRWVGRGRGMRE